MGEKRGNEDINLLDDDDDEVGPEKTVPQAPPSPSASPNDVQETARRLLHARQPKEDSLPEETIASPSTPGIAVEPTQQEAAHEDQAGKGSGSSEPLIRDANSTQ